MKIYLLLLTLFFCACTREEIAPVLKELGLHKPSKNIRLARTTWQMKYVDYGDGNTPYPGDGSKITYDFKDAATGEIVTETQSGVYPKGFEYTLSKDTLVLQTEDFVETHYKVEARTNQKLVMRVYMSVDMYSHDTSFVSERLAYTLDRLK